MPKSKRAPKSAGRIPQPVKSKRREKKMETIEKVRSLVEEYEHVFVFRCHNMRNAQLKELRELLKPESVIYMGRKNLIQVALGRDKTEALADNIHLVSRAIARYHGDTGLIFSKADPQELIEKVSAYRVPDFPRSGFIPTRKVELAAGPLPQFPGTMEPMLRKMGLRTALRRGVIELDQKFVAAQPGEPLTPDQAHLLKLLGLQISTFFVELKCHYEDGSFEHLGKESDDDEEEDDVQDDDE